MASKAHSNISRIDIAGVARADLLSVLDPLAWEVPYKRVYIAKAGTNQRDWLGCRFGLGIVDNENISPGLDADLAWGS